MFKSLLSFIVETFARLMLVCALLLMALVPFYLWHTFGQPVS